MTNDRAGLLGVAWCALAAATGCDPRQDSGLDVDLDMIRNGQVNVSYETAAEPEELGVAVQCVLPAPDANAEGACYRLPRDLGLRVNGQAPTRARVVDLGGPALPPSTCSSRQVAEALFTLPGQAARLAVEFSQAIDKVTVTAARPEQPPVESLLFTETVRPGSKLSIELRSAPAALSTDAACWEAWLCPADAGRGDCSGAPLQVSSQPIESGVRLALLTSETSAPGKRSLWLSSRVGAGCDPEPTVSCPGVAGCTAHASYGYRLGPFEVEIDVDLD
jgi:hypothetical protein